jgi:hypothetical protein
MHEKWQRWRLFENMPASERTRSVGADVDGLLEPVWAPCHDRVAGNPTPIPPIPPQPGDPPPSPPGDPIPPAPEPEPDQPGPADPPAR